MVDLLERLQAALADRYAVESEIGRGGMATVFLAEDLKHRRKVAIKVLHPELAAAVGPDWCISVFMVYFLHTRSIGGARRNGGVC